MPSHSKTLENALKYLGKIIQWRLQNYFLDDSFFTESLPHIPEDWLTQQQNPLTDFIRTHELNLDEQLTLLIALAPHIQPDFYDQLIINQLPQDGDYPPIGGWHGKGHRGFLPTGETVLFILGGSELQERLRLQQVFSADGILVKKGVLYLLPAAEGEPLMSGKLILTTDYLDLFITGKFARPHFSLSFPAERISTELEWSDLVLNQETLQQVRELEAWVNHGHTLLHDWGMKRKLKLGYRALFYGEPGTGKTLTVSLLGKYTNKDVYKIDISMVVSKFIGETEKNLANLFAKAESKNWILFFDEADALFGTRTSVRDAHDKYANQEVSYLLQRVENYDGLVILASNFKSNIDEAFIRRFQSIIHFPLPSPKERLKLWEIAFPQQIAIASDIDFVNLSRTYELTGAEIMNIVQYSCLQALDKKTVTITLDALIKSIEREYNKSGKMI